MKKHSELFEQATEEETRFIHKDDISCVVNIPDDDYSHYAIQPSVGMGENTLLKFQTGSFVKGINGITIESLLAICRDRLKHHNEGPHRTQDNEDAIYAIDQAIESLNKRVRKRKKIGLYGTGLTSKPE